MKKYRRPASKAGKSAARKVHRVESVSWLPIDSRLLPILFTFNSVKGVARLFLQIEMFLAVVIVFGTILLFVLRMLS